MEMTHHWSNNLADRQAAQVICADIEEMRRLLDSMHGEITCCLQSCGLLSKSDVSQPSTVASAIEKSCIGIALTTPAHTVNSRSTFHFRNCKTKLKQYCWRVTDCRRDFGGIPRCMTMAGSEQSSGDAYGGRVRVYSRTRQRDGLAQAFSSWSWGTPDLQGSRRLDSTESVQSGGAAVDVARGNRNGHEQWVCESGAGCTTCC